MVKAKVSKAKVPLAKSCSCGSECHDKYAVLPGCLLIAFGVLALMINYGFVITAEWAKAWPVLLVLFGFVYVAKVFICKHHSS